MIHQVRNANIIKYLATFNGPDNTIGGEFYLQQLTTTDSFEVHYVNPGRSIPIIISVVSPENALILCECTFTFKSPYFFLIPLSAAIGIVWMLFIANVATFTLLGYFPGFAGLITAGGIYLQFKSECAAIEASIRQLLGSKTAADQLNQN